MNIEKIIELSRWLKFKAWEKTDSSNIKRMKWTANPDDPKTGVMQVEFISGDVYEYLNVPEFLYNEILNSDSVGSSFYWNVREQPSVYPYKYLGK